MKPSIFLALLFASATLTIGLLSGSALAAPLQCSVKASCSSGETNVLGISSLSNAHAESGALNTYGNRVCCSATPITLGVSCSSGTAFLNLSSQTNAHVEKVNQGYYTNPACISGTLIGCDYGTDCNTMGVPVGTATCLASISSDTNAHIGNCTGTGSYNTKVCCWLNDITPPQITLDYRGISGNHWVGGGEAVTFSASATDNVGGTGLNEIKLYVEGSLVKTCATSPCEWTKADGYAAGDVATYRATASDNTGNSNNSLSSFTMCKLDSVSIAPFDCGSFGCEQGNNVRISVQFSGNTCPSPAYIQVDAKSADNSCTITRLGGNITGMDAACSAGSPCTGDWVVPAVPASCEGKTVLANSASIRDVLNPAVWRQFGWLATPSGSFLLRGGTPALASVSASKLYLKQGGQVTIYSITGGGASSKRLDCSASGTGGLCSGTAASNPSCSFNSPWPDNGEKIVQCWVYDISSGMFSSNKTVALRADNTQPSISWASPASPAYKNTNTNRNIDIDSDVSDPLIQPGILGAGIVNGIDCNAKIDGGTATFTGSVLYSSTTGKCSGTITLNTGGLSEGTHTLSLDVPDNSTAPNTAHVARQLVIDNTPPQAWIQPLPQWKNASVSGVSFPVSWNGTDLNSPSGSGIRYYLQYAVFDQSGTIWPSGWTDWNSTYNNYTQIFGPAQPINPASYDGNQISFAIKAVDMAGNIMDYNYAPPRKNTTIDVTPPLCTLTAPQASYYDAARAIYFVGSPHTLLWSGADSISGVASYDVNYYLNNVWDSLLNKGCTGLSNPITVTSASCTGANNHQFNFSCRAIDKAGNIGPWPVPNISVRVDTEPPLSSFSPLHEWIGRHSSEWLGSEYFNLSWSDNNDDSPGSGVKCFYVKWSNSTTRADPNPTKRWVNITSSYSTTDPACLNPASSARYAMFGDGNTVLNDNETYNFSIMSVDNIGNPESWDSGANPLKVKSTTIDRYNPVLNSWVKDSSGSIIQPGYLDSSRTTYVNITSNASDNISGIYSNIIYLAIVQKNIDSYMSISSSQSDCVGGVWSTPPNGGNRTCTVKVDYADGTVITYDITATDRANNANTATGVITTHMLANFLVHLAILSLGTTVDIPVQVRNLEATTQNLTLGLEGFGMAAFLPADQLTMLEPCSSLGRCANITLSSGEQRTIYARVIANDITNMPEDLNLIAVSSSGVVDNDTALIIIGYPADFPAFDAWWAVLLMMIFAGIVFYRTEISV